MGIIAKFKKLGPKIFIKKILGYEPVFACAIRNTGDDRLYNSSTNRAFHLIPIDPKCWYADPLLFEYENRTFLFMESWGYRSRKGVIKCTELVGDTITAPQTVIEEDFHISFPNVFYFRNEIYMIPEMEESGGISIYHCKQFPNEWERISDIVTDRPLIDCVIESIDHNCIYVLASTFDPSDDMKTGFWHFKLEYENGKFYYSDSEKENNLELSFENRNAGRMILLDNATGLHCVQRSTRSIYGYSLKFYKSVCQGNNWVDDRSNYVEVLPSSIKIDKWKKKIIGTHTYSSASKYEVIDISYFRWSPMNWVRQITKRR